MNSPVRYRNLLLPLRLGTLLALLGFGLIYRIEKEAGPPLGSLPVALEFSSDECQQSLQELKHIANTKNLTAEQKDHIQHPNYNKFYRSYSPRDIADSPFPDRQDPRTIAFGSPKEWSLVDQLIFHWGELTVSERSRLLTLLSLKQSTTPLDFNPVAYKKAFHSRPKKPIPSDSENFLVMRCGHCQRPAPFPMLAILFLLLPVALLLLLPVALLDFIWIRYQRAQLRRRFLEFKSH